MALRLLSFAGRMPTHSTASVVPLSKSQTMPDEGEISFAIDNSISAVRFDRDGTGVFGSRGCDWLCRYHRSREVSGRGIRDRSGDS
jgi:hypothetical protein